MNAVRIRKKSEEPLFDGAIYIITFFILLVVMYPLIFVVSASFSDPMQVLQGRVWLLPKGLNVEAYKMVLQEENIWLGYKNTILYTVVGTSINLIMTILAAYPLSRKDLPGGNKIMLFITFTMFFNGGLIPTYLVIKNLKLVNTFWVMIVPTAITTYNLIVMRTYFQNSIPKEMQESAFIDGCSNFRLLWSIILPLSKPIIAVTVLFYGVGHWNAFFNALIYLRDSKLYPLQLILRDILLRSQIDEMGADSFGMKDRVMLSEGIKYAVIIVASVPVLAVYPFIQRYFVKGVMIGAIKG